MYSEGITVLLILSCKLDFAYILLISQPSSAMETVATK
jgi:hypothetical protein